MTAEEMASRESLLEYLTVLRCQAGDVEAFARLHAQYDARLRGYVSRLVTSDVAEDVVQDTWVMVYRRVARLTNPGAFRPWLYRIARSKALDALRREKRRGVLRTAMAQQVSTWESGEAAPDTGEHGVEQAMAELSREHREVLQLRYFQDLPYSEVACVVGCSIGTVRSRLHHAKAALREALEKLNRDPPGSQREVSHD